MVTPSSDAPIRRMALDDPRMDRLLSNTAVDKELGTMPGWRREERGIRRRIRCASFADSIALVNAIAALADEFDHQPDIDIRGRHLLVFLRSYEADGVTPRDIALARAIDGAAAEPPE